MSDRYKPGDWVRFYHNGKLVVGVVEYLCEEVGCNRYLDTDRGTVSEDSVKECRPGPRSMPLTPTGGREKP